jgi:hypothetical protein
MPMNVHAAAPAPPISNPARQLIIPIFITLRAVLIGSRVHIKAQIADGTLLGTDAYRCGVFFNKIERN